MRVKEWEKEKQPMKKQMPTPCFIATTKYIYMYILSFRYSMKKHLKYPHNNPTCNFPPVKSP